MNSDFATSIASRRAEIEVSVSDEAIMEFDDAMDRDILPILDAIDDIRPYVKNLADIANMLPTIVVVGDQSSGKSSLLESLSGVQLPRGAGICTRVPLELQLRKGDKFYARLEYQRESGEEKTVRDDVPKDAVGDKINQATIDIAGGQNDIRDTPIILRIQGPKYHNITLIDLPGIARVPLPGQPENIEEITMELIRHHISGEAKVILCVLPSTNDFVTSAALKLAMQADKSGYRTLGVVTKADLASKGINAKLEGTDASEHKLRLGCVAVRCRTPQELEEGVSLTAARKLEAELFNTHEELKHVMPSCKGLPALVEKLICVQKDRLEKCLPNIFAQMNESIENLREKYAAMKHLVEDESDAMKVLFSIVWSLNTRVSDLCNGCVLDGDPELQVPRIIHEISEDFATEIKKKVHRVFTDDVFAQIEDLSKKFEGVQLPNFPQYSVFAQLFISVVHSEIHEPAKAVCSKAYSCIQRILMHTIQSEMEEKYPTVVAELKKKVSNYLDGQRDRASGLVEDLIKASKEVSIFTSAYMDVIEAVDLDVAKFQAHQISQSRNEHNTEHFTASKSTISLFQSEDAMMEYLERLSSLKQGNREKMMYMIQISLASYAAKMCNALSELVPQILKACFITEVCHSEKGFGRYLVMEYGNGDGIKKLLKILRDTKALNRKADIKRVMEDLEEAQSRLSMNLSRAGLEVVM